ncbi:hypothetical protein [Nakamurella sp.]|uniref:hypothetical protein n=1 Tax=Nakamurella sp. TaxID=1869182 RepID=UPI003784855B
MTMFVGGLRERAAEAAPPRDALGLRICNGYEVNVVNTARDALVRADDIGSDHVVSLLGTHRMTIEDDVVTPVKEVDDRLGSVPIGEDHRCSSRRDHGFDPVVTRGSMAGGPTRARTASVR